MRRLVLAAALATTFAVASTAAHANLVTNGDFEAGLSGWSVSGWGTTNNLAGVSAYQGNLYAETGCVNRFCTLSQSVATVSGASYNLSFAFNPGQSVANGGGETKIYWNGIQVADIVGGNLGWTTYSISGLLATQSSTTLLFSGYQNPAWNGLDVVTVTANSVPEPATLAIAGLALLGMGATRRKAAKKD